MNSNCVKDGLRSRSHVLKPATCQFHDPPCAQAFQLRHDKLPASLHSYSFMFVPLLPLNNKTTASGFSAKRYRDQHNALAVVSCPASLGIRAKCGVFSRTHPLVICEEMGHGKLKDWTIHRYDDIFCPLKNDDGKKPDRTIRLCLLSHEVIKMQPLCRCSHSFRI